MEENTQPAKRARRAPAKAAKPATAVRQKKGESGVTRIAPSERLQMIQTAAYFRAERRGFAGGSDLEDWIAAEREVDATLGAVQEPRKASRPKRSPAN